MLFKKKEGQAAFKKEKPKKRKKEKAPEPIAVYPNGAVNYNVYVMTKPEKLFYILAAAAGLFFLGFVFYRSIILSALLALLALKYPKYRSRELMEARKKRLNIQFKDMLYSLSSAVSAGSSVERGLLQVKDDMLNQYADPNIDIIRELNMINSKIALGQNIEDVIRDLGERSGSEDIASFASIFEIAKRTGGNLVQIIRETTDTIAEKIEIEGEIDTLLAGKKMEQKVLTAMPILLVFVLTETTDGFMTPIFTTFAGRLAATVALIMITIGYFWSKKIASISI